MDKKTIADKEDLFAGYLQTPPYPAEDLAALFADVPQAKADEWLPLVLEAFAESSDFAGALRFSMARKGDLDRRLSGPGVRDALKKCTKDRLLLSFVDSVGFGSRPTGDALARLGRLAGFATGALVLHQTWGLGEIRRLDYFYRRVTVDFPGRKGHQFSFDAACDTLAAAPENHILVTAKADPVRIEKMLKDEPGSFVKEMLRSFGDMPLARLEDLSAQFGFVKHPNWKAFWERARQDLRKDGLVEIPARRNEPLHLKASAETYGEGWFTAFSQMTDPKSILSSVRELQGTGRLKGLDEAARARLSDRLAYALKGARRADDALYARLAMSVYDLALPEPDCAKMRAYLWEGERYLEASRSLPAREMKALVAFMSAQDRDAAKEKLFAAMPRMGFPLLSETLDFFRDDEACEEAAAALLKTPKAPATLVTCVLGRYGDFRHWKKLPPLVVILTHAIALGEGRQTGETLRMQNIIRRLFADQKWLEGIFSQLPPHDQALFFERFQASIAWDPSTHHMIVVRMTRIVPELAGRQIRVEEKKPAARVTSLRSYAERKAAYLKLVNVDIPKNAHDIDVARGYGDLRENFEYQSAKDEQRALLQKQTVMQDELNEVKPVDFSDVVSADTVRPGTMATIVAPDGTEKTFTILGEWDNDLDRNIISNRARLAENLFGKKAGDSFDYPDAEGNVSSATVKSVDVLSAEMREWIKVPEGMSV